jgi:hypothetical protein
MGEVCARRGNRLGALAGARRRVALAAAAALALAAPVAAAIPASAQVTVTSHFVWTADAANTSVNVAYIQNGATDGEPHDLLFITPNFNPGGLSCECSFLPYPLGVWYDSARQEWAVFTENHASMTANETFNILVVPKASKSVFVVRATKSSAHGDRVLISSALTNGKPSASIQVTQDFNPGGTARGTYNPNVAGVRYYPSVKRWAIFNEDGKAIPLGAAFNVLVGQAASNGGRTALLTTTSKNRVGVSVNISNPETTGNPNNVTFVTDNFNPDGKGGTTSAHPAAVDYGAPQEAVFNEDLISPPLRSAYNLLIFSS